MLKREVSKNKTAIELLISGAENKKGIERIQCLLSVIFLCLFNNFILTKRKMTGGEFIESENDFQDRLSQISFIILFCESQLRKDGEIKKIRDLEEKASSSLKISLSLFKLKELLLKKGIDPKKIRSLLLSAWRETAFDSFQELERNKNPGESKSVLSFLARQTLSFLQRAESSPENIGTTKEYLESFFIKTKQG
ncbi:MAG: hypothetical protein WC435_03925 [Candidatus Paceibacterota bacterium]